MNIAVFYRNIIVALIIFFIFSACVNEARVDDSPSGIIVSISSEKKTFDNSEDIILNWAVTNPTDNTFKLLKWYTPLDGVERSLFSIHYGNDVLPYLGKLIKRSEPKEDDYVTLAPGDNIVVEISVSDFYEFSSSGDYKLTYDVASSQLYFDSNVNARLISNTITITIK